LHTGTGSRKETCMSFLKHWRFLLLTLVAIGALGAFAACGDNNEGGGASGGATSSGGGVPSGQPTDLAPDSEQVLRWNIEAEPNSLDPAAIAYTYEISVVHNTYLTLFDQDP